jgi:cysteinyl-tRNA synthetase
MEYLKGGYLTLKEILEDPTEAPLPTSLDGWFKSIDRIAKNITSEEEVEALSPYILRLPKVMQVVLIRELMRKNKEWVAAPSIRAWVEENSLHLNDVLLLDDPSFEQ